MYNDGAPMQHITDKCMCCIGTVYNTINRYNVSHRGRVYFDKASNSLASEIINRYLAFESRHSISKTMNIRVSIINRILKENNVKPISYAKRINKELKEDYFEKIDNNEKAYWIGWLLTDGCISKSNTISITLSNRDRYILELLQEDIGIKDRIKPFNGVYSRLSFCCKKMKNDLAKYGIIENKTFVAHMPIINDALIPALLRGCFEGDGGISKTNRNGKVEYELSFTGNLQMVTAFNNMISKQAKIKEKNILKNHNIWRVRWSSNNELIKILKILYNDDDRHHLLRKYNFLKEISNEV